jgi:F-type H+-transporting ATPase subunit epsilon
MRLKVLLPIKILVEEDVTKVKAEAQDGAFCLLPGHIDFAAALVPGLLSFERPGGAEEFVAVGEGILVKRGQEILVSTGNASKGAGLGELKRMIEEDFKKIDEQEKNARSTIAKIEAGFVRRFLEVRKSG